MVVAGILVCGGKPGCTGTPEADLSVRTRLRAGGNHHGCRQVVFQHLLVSCCALWCPSVLPKPAFSAGDRFYALRILDLVNGRTMIRTPQCIFSHSP